MPRVKKVDAPVGDDVKPEVEIKELPLEVPATGKFQAIQMAGGYVVFNQRGQRCSDVIGDAQAKDIVRAQNLAAHLG